MLPPWMFGGPFTAQTGTFTAATPQLRCSTLPECLWAVILGVLLAFFASASSPHDRSAVHEGAASQESASDVSALPPNEIPPNQLGSDLASSGTRALHSTEVDSRVPAVLSEPPVLSTEPRNGTPDSADAAAMPAAPAFAVQMPVGMCGERGESTKAPPIIYPSVTATATGCTAAEMSLTGKAPGTPTKLAEGALDVQQEQAVLLTLPQPAARSEARTALPTSEAPRIREHVAYVPRPPQFCVPVGPRLSPGQPSVA